LALLWPLWLITALSAIQGFADPDARSLLGWFAISAAVGIGEEGVFRGLIIAAVGAEGVTPFAVAIRLASKLFSLPPNTGQALIAALSMPGNVTSMP